MFTPEAVAYAYELTRGQPWLVNALASEIVDRMGVPATMTVTPNTSTRPPNGSSWRRETHIDSLLDKLREPAVRGSSSPSSPGRRSTSRRSPTTCLRPRPRPGPADRHEVEIANPIYRNVITRVLADGMFAGVPGAPQPRSFILPDGRLGPAGPAHPLRRLLAQEPRTPRRRQPYREVTPHVTLLGYLDRAIRPPVRSLRVPVSRAAASSTASTASAAAPRPLIRWNHTGPTATPAVQREALEIKTHRPGDADPTDAGIHQLDGYLLRLGLPTGYLVIFDQRPPNANASAPKWVPRQHQPQRTDHHSGAYLT